MKLPLELTPSRWRRKVKDMAGELEMVRGFLRMMQDLFKCPKPLIDLIRKHSSRSIKNLQM